jgi:integrase
MQLYVHRRPHLIRQWLAECGHKWRENTRTDYLRILDRHLLPALGSIPPHLITRDDIRRALRAIPGAGVRRVARTVAKGFFDWAISEGRLRYPDGSEVQDNPCNGLKVARSGKRERKLSEAELVAIWHASAPLGDFGRIVRLMILTGCRRDEIGALSWAEISGPCVELPAERSKNKLAHRIHLAPLALAQLPEPRPGHPHCFGRVRGRGFNGWNCKRDLDAALIGMDGPWQLRDLRRSFVTHCNERGLALPHHVEACVNHVGGHKGGVAGVYNKAQYSAEKRALFEKWADHIGRIIQGGAA